MPKSVTKIVLFLTAVLFFCWQTIGYAQQPATEPKLWHGKERSINYHPDGGDIVIVNGQHRFNRAIYGTNTAFRIEAGDLPEFGLYLPGMGGNLRFGLITGSTSKWLISAQNIEARYRPGSMIYTINDPMLGKGSLTLTVLAGGETESLIVKAVYQNVDAPVSLFWAFGGATGKKFSRDGDLGADPESSFYLKPEYCANNVYKINGNAFSLNFTGKATTEADRYEIKQPGTGNAAETVTEQKLERGIFPLGAEVHLADANKQNTPLEFWQSKPSQASAITGMINPKNLQALYFELQSPAVQNKLTYATLPAFFNDAEKARVKIASRIKVETPDPYINTLGGVLSIAADAVYESPSYMHGAVAWRMRLNAWRGPYVADVLGWHDRARSHFSSYALSQITSPETGPVIADTALHIARQLEKLGTSMFSSGYISRNPGGKPVPHHYDMNLVFIDELLNHFYWTGDLDYVKKMWPLLKRHLAWEKRNFDADGDGLYDAYCAIWASDAVQYSGGGVTHSSAYNYRANKMAAYLAKLIGENPVPYQKEADHILAGINKTLWLPPNGQYAEYQDLLGLRQVHPSAGLWTVYHAIDSNVPDAFQAYQALRYVDTQIPHIPIIAKGAPEGLYTLPTTNWMPYTWSTNNVVLAEVLHTSLAYWQGGRPEDAFRLWKSSLIQSMYLENSAGNFDQLSFYDAQRGELYRDFADPIGMAGRSLVEGLFGIRPNGLNDTLTIHPGLPMAWDHASLHTPDIQFDYKRTGNTDKYLLIPTFAKPMKLNFELGARAASVKAITVNGKAVNWTNMAKAVDMPVLQIEAGIAPRYDIQITWNNDPIEIPDINQAYSAGDAVQYQFYKADVLKVYDPQGLISNLTHDKKSLKGTATGSDGSHTLFVNLKQGRFTWWEPVNMEIKPVVEIIADEEQKGNELVFKIKSNTSSVNGKIIVNPGKAEYTTAVNLKAGETSGDISVPLSDLVTGSNVVRVEWGGKGIQQNIVNWNIPSMVQTKFDTVNISRYFNDEVTNIFKNKYMSPRPQVPTLQLPWQGIGNWCYPLVDVNIDDSGLRQAAGSSNQIILPQHIPLAMPSKTRKNIVFTSQWDNYPRQVDIQLSGNASHAYFLMAGSTNPMQSRMVNGKVVITYQDNTTETLPLKNPETWWPIEQDYDNDGYAFQLNAARPIRVYLKSGLAATAFSNYKGIKGYASKGIDGGAATVLDMPLNAAKQLKSLQLKTLSNDVVIGLMSVTLARQ